MVIIICPRCQERAAVTKFHDDFVHTCSSGKAVLDEEDVLDITPANWNWQGAANRLWGTRAAIEGANEDDLSPRGKRTAIFKQEQHQEYIKLTGNK